MIRIDRGKEIKPGIWEYSIPSLGLGGKVSPASVGCVPTD